MVLDRQEESELIARCKAGDDSAYECLYQAYYRQAYGAACLISGDQNLAADAVQEAFIRAFTAMDRFREGHPFKPWLFTIVTNETRRLMARKRRFWFFGSDRIDSDLEPVPGPELYALGRERAAELWHEICALPESSRTVLVLRYYMEMGEEEMAQVLGVAPGTVKSRLSRAREKLKGQLPTVWKEESYGVGT